MAGRPKVSDPKEPLTGRVRGTVRAKFLVICEKERRTQSDMVALVLQDFVAAYEQQHGEIKQP